MGRFSLPTLLGCRHLAAIPFRFSPTAKHLFKHVSGGTIIVFLETTLLALALKF